MEENRLGLETEAALYVNCRRQFLASMGASQSKTWPLSSMTTFLGDFSYGTETHWLTGLAMELYCPPGNSAWLFIPTLFSLRSLGITWELVRNALSQAPSRTCLFRIRILARSPWRYLRTENQINSEKLRLRFWV